MAPSTPLQAPWWAPHAGWASCQSARSTTSPAILGLPLQLEQAIGVITAGAQRSVDAAEVNGAIFVNNSSIGVYPMMVLDRERMKKGGLNKWASLVWASTKSFVRFRCLRVTELEVDGKTMRLQNATGLRRQQCLPHARRKPRQPRTARRVASLLSISSPWARVVPPCAKNGGRRVLRTPEASIPEYEEFHVEQFTVAQRANAGCACRSMARCAASTGPSSIVFGHAA